MHREPQVVGRSNPSRVKRGVSVFIDSLEPRRLLSAASPLNTVATHATTTASLADTASTLDGYTPGQINHVYGFDAAPGSSTNGAGQTIAIVEAFDSPQIVQDLAVFNSQFSLPSAPSVTKLNQTGGASLPVTNAGWARETALDVEWAHAIAPAANIVIVEAQSDRLSDLLTAVDTARHLQGVSVVSMSWGVNEFADETLLDDLFTTPAGHIGVTFIASSGDRSVSTSVQWPSSSPGVVGVGGTTLLFSNVNSPVVEVPWAGSVSGTSSFESAPSYQGKPLGAARTTPDVSYNADPSTGYAVYDSTPFDGVTGWQVLGGTSAGAPQWAGLVAIANQARVAVGQDTLDSTADTLPALYQFYAVANGVAAEGGSSPSTTTSTISGYYFQTTATGFSVPNMLTIGGTPVAGQVIGALADRASAPKTQSPTTTARPPFLVGDNTRLQQRASFFAIPMVNVTRAVPFAANMRIHSVGNAAAGGTFVTGATFIESMTIVGGATLHITFAGRADLAAMIAREQRDAVLAQALAGTLQFAQAAAGWFAPTTGTAATIRPAPTMVEALVIPLVPARQILHVAHVNATAILTDALAAFIDESADPAYVEATSASNLPRHARAWAITAGVLAIDSLVLAYVHSRHTRRKSRQVSRGNCSRLDPVQVSIPRFVEPMGEPVFQ